MTSTQPRLRSLNFSDFPNFVRKRSFRVEWNNNYINLSTRVSKLNYIRGRKFSTRFREKWTKLRMNRKKRSSGLERERKRKREKKINKSKWNFTKDKYRDDVLTSLVINLDDPWRWWIYFFFFWKRVQSFLPSSLSFLFLPTLFL